jgi:sugar (pentulose or hexulose) kinase
MRILALDVGISCIKAAALDVPSGEPVGPVAQTSYVLDHPAPEAAQVPADRLWDAVAAAARQAARGVDGIEGVGLSCVTPMLVLLDGADKPVAPIWTNLDRRSRPAARQTWAHVGEEFLATTGNRPLPGGISVIGYRQQIEEEPYHVRSIKSYLHVNGWLGLRLTGERAFDRGNACFTGLFGTMTDQAWSPRWCAHFEVDPAWLPPVACGSTTIGTLRSAAAAELGVIAGLPVKIGTSDVGSAMLAANMKPGDLLHCVGATQILAALIDKPRPDARRLTSYLGVGPSFMHITHQPIGGPALGWLRQLCFRDQDDKKFYERTIPEAEKITTRVTLDPPFLGGDPLEIEACRASFRDLTLATDRLELLAALVQAMRLRHVKALAALGVREKFERVFLSGDDVEAVRRLLPEYAGSMNTLRDGSLRGVARLF